METTLADTFMFLMNSQKTPGLQKRKFYHFIPYRKKLMSTACIADKCEQIMLLVKTAQDLYNTSNLKKTL